MTVGRNTEDGWMELLRATYPDARDGEFVRKPEGIYFRMQAGRDGEWTAAWFHAHCYGFVQVKTHG